MIDTHCHLLNGLDDGSHSRDYTLAMLEDAQRYGIRKIIATPHCWPGVRYQNDHDKVRGPYHEALDLLAEKHLDIDLYYGCELYTTAFTLDWLRESRALTMGRSSYILLEFPWIHSDPTINATEIIAQIQAMGYRVIIAHPERYDIVREDIGILQKWRTMGCYFQINRTSLINPEAWEYELAWQIAAAGHIDIIATDAHHHSGLRIMRLDDVYELIRHRFNNDLAYLWLDKNPQRIIDDLPLLSD